MTVRHEDLVEAFACERADTGGPDFIVTPRVTGGGR